MLTRWPGAPTIETYETHPFLAALEAGELDEEIARGLAGGSGQSVRLRLGLHMGQHKWEDKH